MPGLRTVQATAIEALPLLQPLRQQVRPPLPVGEQLHRWAEPGPVLPVSYPGVGQRYLRSNHHFRGVHVRGRGTRGRPRSLRLLNLRSSHCGHRGDIFFLPHRHACVLTHSQFYVRTNDQREVQQVRLQVFRRKKQTGGKALLGKLHGHVL